MKEGYSSDVEQPQDSMVRRKDGRINAGLASAAVLGLALAFGGEIRSRLEPVEQIERVSAQKIGRYSAEEAAKLQEKQDAYYHVSQMFEDVFNKGEYIAQRREKHGLGTDLVRGGMDVFILQPLTVDGTYYSRVVLEKVNCPQGLNTTGFGFSQVLKCANHGVAPGGYPHYVKPYRITLQNGALRGVYQYFDDRYELNLFLKEGAKYDPHRLQTVNGVTGPLQTPNNTYFIGLTGETINLVQQRVFVQECQGEGHQYLEQKLQALQTAITVLYDARKAREKDASKKAEEMF